MAKIEIKNLTRSYGLEHALQGVNCEFIIGRHYAVCGSSGSGKSTLLHLLGGLDRPTSGEIQLDGENIFKWNDTQLANYRSQKIGFIFQFHFLLPSMNCMDNILLPSRIAGQSIKNAKKKAIELAQRLGVESLLKKYPFEISGGEQQRINLIRALSTKPEILLCDEPTGSLDSTNSTIVIELLKQLAEEQNALLVVVTHNNEIASQFEHRIDLKDGLLQ